MFYRTIVQPFLVILLAAAAVTLQAAERVLEPAFRHLRNAEPREWSDFAERAEASELVLPFEADAAFQPQTLRLRHRDLKQTWAVQLDGREIAKLPTDENEMVTFWSLPPESRRPGKHELRIGCRSKTPDDVLIGSAVLETRSRDELLGEATVEAEVVDIAGRPMPCRLTIVDANGSLMTLGLASSEHVAVRPGVVYTSDGHAKFALPAGTYTLYAGRGFEYSLARESLVLKPGETVRPKLTLTREVSTDGWVSCDTHIHTLTFSGHGDATIDERMLTLAGEGVELPITTEHNRHVDYRPFAEKLGLSRHFTTVVGNEVTTKVGHFNVFPLTTTGPVIDHLGEEWQSVATAIRTVVGGAENGTAPIVVLNHARDVHQGFRPFDPGRHIAAAGEDRDDWKLQADAMEVINSGAVRTDPWTLFEDWMGLLNRGFQLAPIGASDTHDVSRYIVGQGRTYLEVDDRDPGKIDAAAAMRSLREGRVMAGMGLLCRVKVNERFGPGALVPHEDRYRVDVDVLGPSWVGVDEVRIYLNGIRVPATESDAVSDSTASLPPGVRRRLRVSLPKLTHDAHLVVIANGPGIDAAYWPTAKPYQPTSPDHAGYVIGCCGAIRIDADGDGKFSSAFDYARRLTESTVDTAALVRQLADFDEAVAIQTASVLHRRGGGRFEQLVDAADQAPPQTKRGVQVYFNGWKALLPK